MGTRKGNGESVEQAARGIQELLTVNSASVPLTSAQQSLPLVSAGSFATAGDYYADISVRGLTDLEVHVRASAVAGTVTPSAYATYADGTTSKTAATDSGSGALVAAARRTFTINNLRGVSVVRFKFVVAGASSVTFDQAEANGA